MSLDIYGVIEHPEAGTSVRFTSRRLNLCTVNGLMLCEHLGLPIDRENMGGEWPAAEVKERCLLARAVGGTLSDTGMPSAVDGGPGTGRARWHSGGVRPGYFAEKTAELERLADVCLKLGIEVSYS